MSRSIRGLLQADPHGVNQMSDESIGPIKQISHICTRSLYDVIKLGLLQLQLCS